MRRGRGFLLCMMKNHVELILSETKKLSTMQKWLDERREK